MDSQYRFLFGPVRSRRLGRSLGIDLVPFKVCTFDCPYCQVGATVTKTLQRAEYVPMAGVLSEFDDWLARDGRADCLTLAGAGEPTLHSRFGEVLCGIRRRCSIRRVLLSNGSLFQDPQVRAAALNADVVKATLGSWDQESFERVHHPCAGLAFDAFLAGLALMRREFSGEYWIEVFLIGGVNDGDEPVQRIADLVKGLRPDKVHLNTAVRPPWDAAVKPVSEERLRQVAEWFTPMAEVVAAGVGGQTQGGGVSAISGDLGGRLLQLIRRHPCSAEEAMVALGAEMDQVSKALEALMARKEIRLEWREGRPYFVAVDRPSAGV